MGIIYFMLMKASGPPLFSISSRVSWGRQQLRLAVGVLNKFYLNKIPDILCVSLMIVNTISDVH